MRQYEYIDLFQNRILFCKYLCPLISHRKVFVFKICVWISVFRRKNYLTIRYLVAEISSKNPVLFFLGHPVHVQCNINIKYNIIISICISISYSPDTRLSSLICLTLHCSDIFISVQVLSDNAHYGCFFSQLQSSLSNMTGTTQEVSLNQPNITSPHVLSGAWVYFSKKKWRKATNATAAYKFWGGG